VISRGRSFWGDPGHADPRAAGRADGLEVRHVAGTGREERDRANAKDIDCVIADALCRSVANALSPARARKKGFFAPWPLDKNCFSCCLCAPKLGLI